ncbi:MAG: nucleotidyltransferase substrate binding protein [Candidatus Omnitrophota bacterium]|nr:MAG: nucleotidyltransferase substrate binding protein [Candidatus Omnitrophota bacterium]
MKEGLKYVLSKLTDAFNKLKEGVKTAEDELEKDGVIQRFEFTFELLWKTLKIFLRENGIETNTPKDSLKEAFRIGWLKEENIFLNMLEDRNKSSHIYDKETSEEIVNRVKNNYVPAIEEILKKLEAKIKS